MTSRTLAFVAALALAATRPGFACEDPDAPHLHTLSTPLGAVVVVRDHLDVDGEISEGLPHSITVDGVTVFTTDDDYVHLCESFTVSDGVAVLFGSDQSGSAHSGPTHLYFLLLREKRPPKVVTDERFFSENNRVVATSNKRSIHLDLGVDENQHRKSARFYAGKLTIVTK